MWKYQEKLKIVEKEFFMNYLLMKLNFFINITIEKNAITTPHIICIIDHFIQK